MSVPAVSDEGTWDVAVDHHLAAWHAGYRSTLELVQDGVRCYVEQDYPAYAPEAGRLFGLDDELDCGWCGTRRGSGDRFGNPDALRSGHPRAHPTAMRDARFWPWMVGRELDPSYD